MSLTVAVYGTTMNSVTVFYEIVEDSNFLLLSLGGLGAILFVGLLIATCYIMKNTESATYPQNRSKRVLA